MKKSLMITFLLLCVLCGCAVAEDVGFYLPDDCVMLQCAPSYDSWYEYGGGVVNAQLY